MSITIELPTGEEKVVDITGKHTLQEILKPFDVDPENVRLFKRSFWTTDKKVGSDKLIYSDHPLCDIKYLVVMEKEKKGGKTKHKKSVRSKSRSSKRRRSNRRRASKRRH